MGRKNKRPTNDYDNLTSAEIRAANAKLSEVLAKHVAERIEDRRLSDDDLRAIFEGLTPAQAARLMADVFALARVIASGVHLPGDPTPAQPLQVDDAGAIVERIDDWLKRGL